jgi:hypothetical protein
MINQLQTIRAKIKSLEAEEATIVAKIITSAGHNKIGQGTYDLDGAKVTIITKENVTLDKARLNVIWKETMPINRAYAYTLRQKDYDAIMESGTAAQRKMLSEIVTTKPAKPVVKVEV